MKYLLIISLISTACSPLFQVSDVKNSGIQFFPHRIIETTTTTYQESFFQVELHLTWEEKARKTTSKNSLTAGSAGKFTTKAVRYTDIDCGLLLNTKFAGTKNIKDGYNLVRGSLLQVPSSSPDPNIACAYRDSFPPVIAKEQINENTLSVISLQRARKVEPSPKPLYINIKRPTSGTAEGLITLNSNGTLASAQGKAEGDLVGKIVDKLPINEAISSVLGLTEDTEEESFRVDKAVLIQIKLVLIPVVRNYELAREVVLTNDGLGEIKALNGSYNDICLKVTTTKGSLLTKVDKKEGETINVTGKIALPKEKKKSGSE